MSYNRRVCPWEGASESPRQMSPHGSLPSTARWYAGSCSDSAALGWTSLCGVETPPPHPHPCPAPRGGSSTAAYSSSFSKPPSSALGRKGGHPFLYLRPSHQSLRSFFCKSLDIILLCSCPSAGHSGCKSGVALEGGECFFHLPCSHLETRYLSQFKAFLQLSQ